jgi:hypothetical protein
VPASATSGSPKGAGSHAWTRGARWRGSPTRRPWPSSAASARSCRRPRGTAARAITASSTTRRGCRALAACRRPSSGRGDKGTTTARRTGALRVSAEAGAIAFRSLPARRAG